MTALRFLKILCGFALLSSTALAQKTGPGINELKELKKIDKKVGSGPIVARNDLVYVSYRGTLKNGLEFDSNMGSGANPYSFVAGQPGVIKGWQEGIIGMKVGGTRRLEIPDELGYGDAGSGEKIPPNADLYFEITLHHVVKQGEENYFDKELIKPGSGQAVSQGDLVDVVYTGRLVNGRVFDKRTDRAKPVTFRVGKKKIKPNDRLAIPGLSAAIVGMRVGSVHKITLPPNLAFGYQTRSGVPAQSVLIYELEVVRIRN